MAGQGSTNSSSIEARLIPLGSHAGSGALPIRRPATLVGSRKDIVRLHLDSSTVSKAHCVIILHDWGCSLHDLGSRTHTWVNGQQIIDADLNDGDAIQVGRFQFKYEAPVGATGSPRRAPAAEIDVSTLTDPLPLSKRVFQIGRRAGSDLEFDDNAVSNIHAILFERNGKHYVRDFGSRTGTWLDGKPIHQEELPDGAKLKIGRAILAFRETVADLVVPSPAIPSPSLLPIPPMPVPPAFVAPARAIPQPPPQISKDGPIELDLDLLDETNEPELTDDQIAAELAAGEEKPADTAAELAITSDAIELSPLVEESAKPDDTQVEDDALAALRRGWHGASQVEEAVADEPPAPKPIFESLPLAPEPVVEEAEDPALPLELEFAADDVESDVEADADVVAPEAVADLDLTQIESVVPRSPEIAEDDEDIELVSPEIGRVSMDTVELDAPDLAVPAVETSEIELSTPSSTVPVVPGEIAEARLEVPSADEADLRVPPNELLPSEIDDELRVDIDAEVDGELETEIEADIELAAPAIQLAPAELPVVITPVDDVTDDDGAIDLDDAPPAPVAESLAEPELALEVDSAGLDETPEVIAPELPSPETVAAEVEAVDDLAIDFEDEEASDSVAISGEVADDAEDEIHEVDAPVVVIEPTIEEVAEAVIAPVSETPAEPVVAAPAPEVSIEEFAEAVIEEPTVETPVLEEPVVAAADVPETLENELSLDDELPLDEPSEATLKSAARAEALAELEWIDEAAGDAEATLDLEAQEAVEQLAVEPEQVDEPASLDLSRLELGTESDALDLEPKFQADEEAELADEEKSEAAAEEGEPTPIAELDAIDFSKLTLDEPRAEIEGEDDEADFDRFSLDDDKTTAEPLMNLADSVVGADSVIDVEIVEETLPTLTSAMPESLGDDDDRDSEALLDELGVLDDSLDELPEGDSGDLIDADDASRRPIALDLPTPAAPVLPTPEPTSTDTTDELDDLFRPPPPGSLKDLIPDHGPLVGGAFMSQAQQFMVGGSPIVELTPDEPAAVDEPVARDRTPFIPPTAPPPPANDRRKPMRVGFGGSAPMPAPTSPFAGESRTIADVLIGRRAAQSVDVFANPSPTPEDLLLDETARQKTADGKSVEGQQGGLVAPAGALDDLDGEETELKQTAERFRPRGEIQALGSFPQASIPSNHKPTEDPVYIAQLRRGRLRRVLMCTLLLLPLIGFTVFGVYQFVPQHSKIVASLTFTGLDRKSEDQARQFKAIQNDIVHDEDTRKDAVALLPQGVPVGFLTNISTLTQALTRLSGEPRWPANQASTMKLSVLSTDKENDRARLKAVAEAMIKASRRNIERAQELRDGAATDEAARQALEVQRKAIEAEIQGLIALGETRPDATAIDAVEKRRQEAELELRTTRSIRMLAEAAILTLEKQSPAELAPSPETDLTNADQDLAKLNTQLADLQKQNEAIKIATQSKSEEARKSMEAVISQFRSELDAAQKLKDSPELVQYLEAAKQIFAQTRQLTDDLIRRQENQHTRLSELKQRLSDRIEARTKEMLDKDEQLKRLNEDLAMMTRQRNAAIATEGMAEEVKKLSLRMELHRALIAGRQESFTKDPVYVETISSLQGIIEQTAKLLQEDRKHIDGALTRAQEDFAKNSPAVDKLPAQQKQLAEGIEKRLAAIAEARKAYSAAADAAESEQAKQETELKQKVDGIQLEVHARRQIVLAAAREQQAIEAEANRKKKLEEKKLEVASLVTKEKSAESLLNSVVAEKERMEEHQRKVLSTQQSLIAKRGDKETLELDIRKARNSYEDKRAQLSQLVVPESKFELESYDIPDRRPLFAGVGAGAIFALMLIPIIWNLRLISRDSHHHPEKPHSAVAGFDVLSQPEPRKESPDLNGHTETLHDDQEVAATR